MKLSWNLLLAGVLLALATSALAGPAPTPTATPTSTPVATATATPTTTPTTTPVATPTTTPTTTPTPTATPAATPTATPGCELTIEINALRGGSPTVTVGDTKNITAKARIVRGTAVSGTTIHTTLKIEAIDGAGVIQNRTSCPHRLEVGKGGQGDKLDMLISRCIGGSILFRATFFGNENDDCSNPVCPLATREITKTCK